jgi:hypothetical protein
MAARLINNPLASTKEMPSTGSQTRSRRLASSSFPASQVFRAKTAIKAAMKMKTIATMWILSTSDRLAVLPPKHRFARPQTYDRRKQGADQHDHARAEDRRDIGCHQEREKTDRTSGIDPRDQLEESGYVLPLNLNRSDEAGIATSAGDVRVAERGRVVDGALLDREIRNAPPI